LGIAGVSGNGQSELVQTIVGIRSASRGQCFLDGVKITGASPRDIAALGLGYIPADRDRFGLAISLSLQDNLALKSYHASAFHSGPFLNRRSLRAYAERLTEEFDVKAPSVETLAEKLSGGNRQRLLVARELAREPSVIVANQPTRGLDVAATEYVRGRLLDARERGAGVLLISDDLDEVLSLSDRVMVMYQGELHEPPNLERATIGLLMAGEMG